jgi:hypothetical protein
MQASRAIAGPAFFSDIIGLLAVHALESSPVDASPATMTMISAANRASANMEPEIVPAFPFAAVCCHWFASPVIRS